MSFIDVLEEIGADKQRDLDEIERLRKQLSEAIALLERCYEALGWTDISAFLASRAPTQPAAPHSEEDCDGSCYVQPAAPEPSLERFFGAVPDMPLEPSAEPAQSFDLLGRWRTRAETAEAKIAAVREDVRRAVRNRNWHAVLDAVSERETPAGPNGGAK